MLYVLEPFLCLARDPADISQASPTERMIGPAVAPALFLLIHDSFENGRDTFVCQHIPRYVLFRISETVANLIFHGTVPHNLMPTYNPAFFNSGAISS
jgi:hypothetical protein